MLLCLSYKIVQDRGTESLQQNSICWTRQALCTQDITEVVTICTGSAQNQASQNSGLDCGSAHNVPVPGRITISN